MMGDFFGRLKEVVGENVSQTARELDVPPTTLHGYLAGSKPNIRFLEILAEKTHVNLHWLITGDGPKYVERRAKAGIGPAEWLERLLFAPGPPEYLERLHAIVGTDVPDFGKKIGFSTHDLNGFLRGRRPSLQFLAAIERKAGISLRWLAFGEGEMHMREGNARQELAHGPFPDEEAPPECHQAGAATICEHSDEFELVPRYDIHASAGPGTFLDQGCFIHFLAFRKDWLKQADLVHSDMAAINVTGESMEPTLRSGDIVLVDQSVRHYLGDGLYVLNLDALFLIKRLQRQVDGTLKIISDNPTFGPMTLADEQAELARLIGKVVWIGRRI